MDMILVSLLTLSIASSAALAAVSLGSRKAEKLAEERAKEAMTAITYATNVLPDTNKAVHFLTLWGEGYGALIERYYPDWPTYRSATIRGEA